MTLRWLAAIILAASMGHAAPASACSFTWKPGYSPEDIRVRADLVKVVGQFTFLDARTGRRLAVGARPVPIKGQAFGRVETKEHGSIPVKVDYSDLSIQCGSYLGTPGNVSGAFWIEQQRDKQGRQRLLMWRPQ